MKYHALSLFFEKGAKFLIVVGGALRVKGKECAGSSESSLVKITKFI